MRFIPVATVLLAASLAACNVGGATAQNDNAASAAWRPMPVDDAPEPLTPDPKPAPAGDDDGPKVVSLDQFRKK